METKFISGPYKAGKTTIKEQQPIIISELGIIARFNYADFETDEQAEATVKLMAAAPEMFELLKQVEEYQRKKYQLPDWLYAKVLEVLTKAANPAL